MAASPALAHVDFYPRDGSVFVDTHYLIRGVAGALFWKLARECSQANRSEFSLRELRLAGGELGLPEGQDNLSVRVLLLQKRLDAHHGPLRITRCGRGRIRVDRVRPLELRQVGEARKPVPGVPGTAARP